MGLFGGESSSRQSTKVVTTSAGRDVSQFRLAKKTGTGSTVGDIGLTGSDAKEVLQHFATEIGGTFRAIAPGAPSSLGPLGQESPERKSMAPSHAAIAGAALLIFLLWQGK